MDRDVEIVVCETLRREVVAALRAEGLDDVTVTTREASCGRAAQADGAAFHSLSGAARLVLLGGACCRGISDTMAPSVTRIPGVGGCCAELLLPGALVDHLTRSGAYLATPGWLAGWERRLAEWGFDQATARALFGESCQRLVLLDTGLDPDAPARLIEMAAYVDRPCELLPVGLDLLRAYLAKEVYAQRAARPEPSGPAVQPARSLADAAFVLDVVGRLAELTTEREVADRVFELVEMLFASRRLAYLPWRDGTWQEPVWRPAPPTDAAEARRAMVAAADSVLRTACGAGFAMPIRADRDLVGVLLVDGVALPDHLDDYLNLALHMAPMLAMALTNARRYEQMVEERARYRLARFTLDTVSELALWLSPDGRIVDANEAACAALGYRRDDLLGTAMAGVDHSFEPDMARDVWHRARHGDRSTWLTTFRTHTGGSLPVEVSTRIVEHGGGALLCVLARDVAERLRAEALGRQLDQRLRQARQAASLGALAGGLAHEFNNLLATVMAEAELALGEPADAEAGLGVIIGSAQRGAELCQMMLACAGRAPFSLQPTNLTEVANAALRDIRAGLPEQVAITVECADAVLLVQGDASQLRGVVAGLLHNAVEAIGEASGEVALELRVAWRESGQLGTDQAGRPLPAGTYVLLTVRDTGHGMDRETAERAFDPFFTTRFAGRGLGLAAVLGMVWSHHGSITLDTEPGRGTTVTVALPALAQPAAETTAAASRYEPGGLVLLADDEGSVRRVSTRVLSRLGFEVVAAAGGEEAIRLFGDHAERIRAVVLDVMMPGVSGADALAGMRRVRPDLPAVLMSGHSDVDLKAAGVAGTPTAFLTKPFSQARLRDALAGLLSEPD
ncbi:MAG: response regulator [Armatimonadetes bacterium]|nr:response regulator [Armatimonadota bacterium]